MNLAKAQRQLTERPELIEPGLLTVVRKRLDENAYRPKDFVGLQHVFDAQGKAYYSWAQVGDMPPWRIKKVMGLMRQAEESMSPKDIAMIAKAIRDCVMNEAVPAKSAEDKSASLAKIVVLAEELTYRSEGIIPEDIFYDLAATCCVREDEDRWVEDRTIHLEKYTMIQQAGRAGADFFTVWPMFSDLVSASVTTQEGYGRWLTNWTHRKARLKMVLETVSISKSVSEPTTKSSTSSHGKYRRGPQPTSKP